MVAVTLGERSNDGGGRGCECCDPEAGARVAAGAGAGADGGARVAAGADTGADGGARVAAGAGAGTSASSGREASGASGMPPFALLDALSKAFAYPWHGLAETQDALRNLSDSQRVGYGRRIEDLLAASECFDGDEQAQLAYTRLFIGSFHMQAPPYASFYLGDEHLMDGQAAADVRDVYQSFGIELADNEIAPDDHLRYLLAFLALMAQRYEQTGEDAFADVYRGFRDAYVLSWVDKFCALVDQHAQASYYPALASLIACVLKEKGDS